MTPRLPSLLDSPIGFAHRGARAHAPENTKEAFLLARKLGATGLESDVWLTADGVAVLDHDGKIGSIRRRPIGKVLRAELPEHILTLEEFYDCAGTEVELSLDVKDPDAFATTVAVARNAGGTAEERLWLCHPDIETIIGWRPQTTAKLVDSTRLAKIKEGPERRGLRLRDEGIDAINLRNPDWSGGIISMFHRFDRLCFSWDVQHRRELLAILDAGIDGVYSDHVDRLAAALTYFYPAGLQDSPQPRGRSGQPSADTSGIPGLDSDLPTTKTNGDT